MLTDRARSTVCNTIIIPAYGQQRRLDDSSAFYNPQEAALLVEQVSSLIKEQLALSTENAITDADIGVICLSRAQVVHVRNLFRQERLGGVNVGATEHTYLCKISARALCWACCIAERTCGKLV